MRRMCRCLKVHPSGYYEWKLQPQSARAKDDQRLLGLLKQAWLESGGVYGSRVSRKPGSIHGLFGRIAIFTAQRIMAVAVIGLPQGAFDLELFIQS